MGRYYSGDIEGKFWFGIQSSDSADRFGVQGNEPQYLDYWFQEDDLPAVQEELERIHKQFGEDFKRIDAFFFGRQSYTDEELAEYLGTAVPFARQLLSEYADYELGKKIEESIIKNGQCSFEAEL
jgi:hypothetical protein